MCNTNVLRAWWSIPISDESQCNEGYWEEVVTICREYRSGSCRGLYSLDTYLGTYVGVPAGVHYLLPFLWLLKS